MEGSDADIAQTLATVRSDGRSIGKHAWLVKIFNGKPWAHTEMVAEGKPQMNADGGATFALWRSEPDDPLVVATVCVDAAKGQRISVTGPGVRKD